MAGRFTGTGIVAALFVSAVVSTAHAQRTLPEGAGFQPNRDYLALLPWESIDTGSNNIILTFTDLVLPGNRGRDLRFDRVFSNEVRQDPAGPQWRFGIGGVPMRVVERNYPQGPLPPGNLAAERNTTPYFWMVDGARLETTYVQPPDYANRSTLTLVRTPNFWIYDRVARSLRMPDGTFARYDTDGYLIEMHDSFDAGGTNVVTLMWDRGANMLDVDQFLGNGETRRVHITLDGNTGLPTSLAYNDKTWTYEYGTSGQLVEAIPPNGVPGGATWRYAYSTEQFSAGKVTEVTTPQGGVVSYTYGDRSFFDLGGAIRLFNVLVARRTYDRGVLLGEWSFEHIAQAQDAIDQTEVTLPSATKVVFAYGAASDPNVLAGTWSLRFRTVQAPDGTIVEREERVYTGVQLRAARPEEPWWVPRLTRLTITRSGQTHTTEYGYSASVSPHFHNYHRPITITERGPTGTVERATSLTYAHLLEPSLLALPSTESITISGMTAVKSWTYDVTTGLRDSETLYGMTTTFTPDAFGNVATTTKPNGKRSAATYSWGVVRSTTTPGISVERTINPDGTVASERVAGRTTTYTYDDPLGRLTHIQPAGGTNPITTTYDDVGRTVTRRRGSSVLITTTDGFGRPVETVNGIGVRTRIDYDAEGRTRYQSYPFTGAEAGTEFTYDSLGRVTQEIHPDGTRRTREYDDTTNSVIVRDEENRATVLTYQGFGHPDDARLVSVVDATQEPWTYRYDAIGNLAQVITPTGHARTWVRNTSGLLTGETHPESGTVSYTQYDPAGVLLRKVNANGTEFLYQHDDNDRVTSITAGADVTSIAYEPGSNNRVSMSNGSTSSTFDYDAAGRLAHRRDITGAYVFDSRYTYDGNDWLTAITYPTGRVIGYERDAEGQITRVFETAEGRDYAFGMSYHPSGALEAYTTGNNIPTAITFDPFRYRIQTITAGALRLTYGSYDAVGNVLAIDDSRPGMSQSFTYDTLHRLQIANGPYGSTGYAYDTHGNRQNAWGSTYVYDADTLRLAVQNGEPFGYDNNGNLTSRANATYTYTPQNWLATAADGGRQTAYWYDAAGWRIKKATGGDTSLYHRGPAGELLTEWHILGASARARDYVYAGSRLLSAIERPVTLTTCGGQSIPDGSPTTLTIAPGATGTVTFEGSACRRVSAVITASTVTNCAVFYNTFHIRNPDGTTLASTTGVCAGAIVGPVDLPASGSYTVVIDPADTWSGQVTVSVYDVVDVTGPITPGQAVNASLTTPGQRGYWNFAGRQNQRVSAMINTSTISNCAVFYNTFKIVSGPTPEGNVIGSVGGVCGGALVEPVTLPAAGTYTVVVDPSGSWAGQVSVTAYDVIDVTGPIAFGQSVNASLVTPGQRAYWTFSGTQNQRVSAMIETSTIANCSVFYNRFKIVSGADPNGAELGSVGDVCAGALVEPVVLPATGTYTVVIDPSGSWTGLVSMTVHNVVDVTGPMTFGQMVSGPLTTPGQRGLWTFTGSQNQRVRVTINTSTIVNCAVVYNRFALLNPDGTTLTSVGGLCAGATLGPLTLPTSGIYTVLADPSGSSTGQLSVTAYDASDVIGTMLFGQPVTAALGPGQRAVWTFSGAQNQRVSALINSSTMTNCSASNVFAVVKPDGTTLTSIATLCGGAMLGPVTLPTSGTYTVIVDPDGNSVGQVTVTAYGVVDVTDSMRVNGSAVSGVLTTPGQRGLWTFRGTRSRQVRVILDSSTIASCSLSSHAFRIVKPDGTTLTSTSNICSGSVLGPTTVPANGTYTVVIDPYAHYTGTISLRVVSP